MKKYLPFLIVLAVGLITLGGGALLYRAKQPVLVPTPKTSSTPEANEALHVRGEEKAPVTLEEFGDFQCPPCGTLSVVIAQLEKDYGSRLRVIFFEFPLVMHEHAREAAYAAEAAGLQNRFWEMHDLLYREQANWSKGTDARGMFKAYAGTLGLVVDRFVQDLDSPEVKARVDSQQKLGTTRGVESTPTLFINNKRLPVPALNPAGLRAAIEEALKSPSR